MSVAALVCADFEPHVGTAFTAPEVTKGNIALTLIEAQTRDRFASPGAPRIPFALLFRAENSAVPQQDTYRLRHPVLGELDMFLVPVAHDAAGVIYEAVFN